LKELVDGELCRWIKQARDGHVHRRRLPSALHGDGRIAYTRELPDGGYESVVGDSVSAQQHLSTALAAWKALLVPATSAASLLVTGLKPPRG